MTDGEDHMYPCPKRTNDASKLKVHDADPMQMFVTLAGLRQAAFTCGTLDALLRGQHVAERGCEPLAARVQLIH